jgi:hypothetical protein
MAVFEQDGTKLRGTPSTARRSRCGLKRLKPRLTGEGAGQHTRGRVCSPRIPLRKNSVELRQMPVFVEFCNLNVGVYRLT